MSRTNSTPDPVTTAYIGSVRDELADLPDDVRVDLMDDVVEHVTAVAGEYTDLTMTALVDRLGAPSEYALQLRDAAGLAPTSTVPDRAAEGYLRRLGRFMVTVIGIVAVAMVPLALGVPDPGPLWAAGILGIAAAGMFAFLVRDGRQWKDELERMPGAPLLRKGRLWFTGQTWSAEAVDVTVSLRPGWWVLRGVAVALALGMATVSVPVIFVSVVPLVALSVWLGRRAQRQQPQGFAQVFAVTANAALALTAIGAAIGIYQQATTQSPIYVAHDPYQEVYVETSLTGDGVVYRSDGPRVTNLFPYGPDGQLIEDVWLYDQDGRPFELGLDQGCEEWSEPGWEYLPDGDAKHAYPHRVIKADPATGECSAPASVPPFGPFLPGAPAGQEDPAIQEDSATPEPTAPEETPSLK